VVAVSEPWRPVKVCVIDAEHLPEKVSGRPSYAGLFALVREGGRPRGLIRLDFEGESLRRETLTRAIEALPAVAASSVRAPPQQRLPRVSVVIPSTLARLEALHRCLRSLLALDYPDYEVIVVDNRPGDAPDIRLDGATVVREPHPGISAARNRGIAAADGEIIAFTDDDVEVDPGWLRAISLRLRLHPEEAGVTGLALPRELETPAQLALEDYYGGFGPRSFEPVSHQLRLPRTSRFSLKPATVDAWGDDGRCRRSFSLYAAGSFGPGANMAFRAGIFREVGGFDRALGAGTPTFGGEDLEMFARVVWHDRRLAFEPAALVFHSHRREHESLRRQVYGYGAGYSALLLAMVLRDPRHLGRMLGTVPRGARALGSDYRDKLERRQPDPRTRELARLELQGMTAGPAAYVRSRWRESR